MSESQIADAKAVLCFLLLVGVIYGTAWLIIKIG